MKKEPKKPRKPISLELAAAAQQAYSQEHQQERQAQKEGGSLALKPGWGGQGR